MLLREVRLRRDKKNPSCGRISNSIRINIIRGLVSGVAGLSLKRIEIQISFVPDLICIIPSGPVNPDSLSLAFSFDCFNRFLHDFMYLLLQSNNQSQSAESIVPMILL
jgi:hypothetical protein